MDLDAIGWKAIHDQKPLPGLPAGLAASGRPRNYDELGDLTEAKGFEFAWSEFLHEFYRYRQPSFFTEPPDAFMPEKQALLAGAAEFLCTEFGLLIPQWVSDPQYTLPEPFEPYGWMYVGETEEQHQARIAEAHPLFLKHNVVFAARNLITV